MSPFITVKGDIILAPHLLFYQLLLVALVLICLLMHVWWPDLPRPTPQTLLNPDKPQRQRSQAPQPFTGCIHKPLCAAGEQGADARPQAPGAPPPLLTCTRGRRRTVDTHTHFCPAPGCASRGWLGRGHSRANGPPSGKAWRQLQCVSCRGYFYESHGTLLQGKRSSVELIGRVLACLAEGLGIRGTARVCESDPNTVLQWLGEAAEPLQAFSAYCLPELHRDQIQLDELYAVLNAVRDGAMSTAEALERLSRAPHWVWTAIEPESKRLLAVNVGARPRAMAQCVGHQGAQMLAPDGVPRFLTDGFREYLTALVPHVGHWGQPPRRQARGAVKHRVICGTKAVGAQVWAAWGWQINTAFVARLNRSLRQRVAAVGRRSATVCKSEEGVRQQLTLCQVYHNVVFPHASLRPALAEPVATKGSGSAKVWRPGTPAMVAGRTEHGWSLREVLMFRVPPWPQPQTA